MGMLHANPFAIPGEVLPDPNPSPSYVGICTEANQLGGQLTSFAVVLGYAWANGLQPYFPHAWLLGRPGAESTYPELLHRLPQVPLDFMSRGDFKHLVHVSSRSPVPYVSGHICFCVCPDYPLPYFDQYRDRIREQFAPSEQMMQSMRLKYGFILDHPKTVAVHVRTYHPAHAMHHCLGADYYSNAIQLFPDDHLFVIFSDRISWCKDHLRLQGKKAVFIEGNTNLFDLYLMSRCKNIITANSTFSWWAAYLKADPDGKIYVPSKWFRNENPEDRKAFYPDHYSILWVGEIPPPDWNVTRYPTTSLHDH